MGKLTKYRKVEKPGSLPAIKTVNSLYPERIRIVSDDDELEFISNEKVDSRMMVYYRYTKSDTKLGMILPMPEEQLQNMIRNEICKQIN